METKTLLFSLLREEIFGSNETTEIPPARWEELYALASLHDLGHVPASALERKGIAVQDELSQRIRYAPPRRYRHYGNCKRNVYNSI